MKTSRHRLREATEESKPEITQNKIKQIEITKKKDTNITNLGSQNFTATFP